MFFFFKRNKIIVDCFTPYKHIIELSPIEKANKFIPEWWINTPREIVIPNNIEPCITIKECRGIIDTYNHGYIIPLWSDFILEIQNKQYRWTYSDKFSTAEIHSQKQWENFTDAQNIGHLKLMSPWRIKTKKDIMWSCTDPFWNNKLQTNYMTAPGVVNFKYQYGTNINIFFKLQDQTIKIDFNHPMYHLIPITEHETEIRHHLVTDREFTQLSNVSVSFYNQYIKRKNILKNKKVKQCPFHWDK